MTEHAQDGWGGNSFPKTDPRLLALIKRAATYKMTPQERFDQRVSFVYGQMSGAMTKDRVREILAEGWGGCPPKRIDPG